MAPAGQNPLATLDIWREVRPIDHRLVIDRSEDWPRHSTAVFLLQYASREVPAVAQSLATSSPVAAPGTSVI
jgi:hypothetical protein